MTNNEFIRIYCNQYILLERKVIDFSEYVAIDKLNYNTFSSQLIFLFLSICSEIDSLAGELCKLIDEDTETKCGIIKKIEIITTKYPNLKNLRVQTKDPFAEINIVPFKKFEPNTTSWWTCYNKVKHDRIEMDEDGRYNYTKANLKNVLHSLAALYILINKVGEQLFSYDIGDLPIESNLFNKNIK